MIRLDPLDVHDDHEIARLLENAWFMSEDG